ncbi:MAG: MFS transporter [Spirochaetes bacterium]|nr:MFS transporter [Spirochaetota bacterium]
MLKRFSLYGFLKNQQYYEPFLLLAFLQMGLSFTLIGLLIGFREFMVNLMEVPSGAFADVHGRRNSMIISFTAYIIHFVSIGITGIAAINKMLPFNAVVILLFFSMIFFAAGDAFRTGTHKAIIFAWLREQGRTDEKTKVYGYTRSWSKIGSAVSVVLACIFVYFSKNYVYIFFFSIIPYLINIINFTGYPKDLRKGPHAYGIKQIFLHLKDSLYDIMHKTSLRRLVLESMGFEGFFKSVKDYLQPVLNQAAIPLIALFSSGIAFTGEQKSVILIGPVYCFLFIISAIASRKSHKVVEITGGEDRTAKWIWLFFSVIMIISLPAFYFGIYWLIITGFIILYILQNLWRPVLISRFDEHSNEVQGATVLSVESQAKSLSTMLLAPLIGASVDLVKIYKIGHTEFWPLAVTGIVISLFFLLTARSKNSKSEV